MRIKRVRILLSEFLNKKIDVKELKFDELIIVNKSVIKWNKNDDKNENIIGKKRKND